ncbi:MAG: DoxX family protein [Elusimicrobiales bacterium]
MKEPENNKKPRLTPWEILGFAGRLCAGGIFIYSGFMKFSAPAEEFAYAIETYKVMPAALAMFAAQTVPWAEFFLGVLLVAGLYVRFSSLAIGGMLVFFELLLAQAMLRGLNVTNCGCFGSAVSLPIQVEFCLNLVTLFLSWCAFRYGDRIYSMDNIWKRAPGL